LKQILFNGACPERKGVVFLKVDNILTELPASWRLAKGLPIIQQKCCGSLCLFRVLG
jgi:hypothetical protein